MAHGFVKYQVYKFIDFKCIHTMTCDLCILTKIIFVFPCHVQASHGSKRVDFFLCENDKPVFFKICVIDINRICVN